MPNDLSVADLAYRPMRIDELPGIARLYDLAGWGPMDPATMGEWFFGDPDEPALVMVAVTPHEEIVGMMCYYPCPVQLFDRVSMAARTTSAILSPEVRFEARQQRGEEDLPDPLGTIDERAGEHLDARGWEFRVGMPHPRMQARLSGAYGDVEELLVNTSDRAFDGLKFDLQGPAGAIPLSVVEMTPPFSPEYDTLWDRARANLGIECAVLRSAEGLQKIRAGMFVLECRAPNHDELLGYALFSRSEDSQLIDILGVDVDALHLVAQSTTNYIRMHRDRLPQRSAATLAHPTYYDALRAAGAFPIDWQFGLHIHTHHPEPRPELDTERWYVTTGG